MKSAMLLSGILAIGIAAQWAVPAGMIFRREQALRHGQVCRFQVAPVDPYDAFRGRYVALNLNEREASTADTFKRNQTAYVRLETGANGLTRLAEAALRPGREGVWLRARAAYGNSAGTRTVSIRLPFDRFYMDEESAPRAEGLYRKASTARQGSATNTWLQVRVHRNLGVIEDLYLDGRPIRQVLREEQKAAGGD